MTPEAFTGGFGCKNKNECDEQISNNSFTVGGASYHFVELAGRASTPRFRMQLSANANSGFQGLKLCVGTQEYSFPSSGSNLRTSNTNPGLSTTPVQLRIGSSCALPATDAMLSGLTASSSTSASGTFTALTLDQSFAAGTTAYTATVPNTVDEVKLRPTVADSTATVEVGKGSTLSSVTSGTESAAISLQVGANAITVKVTAEDGSTTKTYTVTVTREEAQAQNNPAPTGLTVTPGNAQLSLSWTAPTGTLTGYDVQYTSALAASVGNSATASGNNPATAWVAVTRSGTTATQTISSLSNGTAYRVRVRAKNSNGNGAWVFGTGTPLLQPTVSLSASPTR